MSRKPKYLKIDSKFQRKPHSKKKITTIIRKFAVFSEAKKKFLGRMKR